MITVHGMHTEQNNFNNCGLAILKPTSCIKKFWRRRQWLKEAP